MSARVLAAIDSREAEAIARECLECATADEVEDLVRERFSSRWPDLFPDNALPQPREQLQRNHASIKETLASLLRPGVSFRAEYFGHRVSDESNRFQRRIFLKGSSVRTLTRRRRKFAVPDPGVERTWAN